MAPVIRERAWIAGRGARGGPGAVRGTSGGRADGPRAQAARIRGQSGGPFSVHLRRSTSSWKRFTFAGFTFSVSKSRSAV